MPVQVSATFAFLPVRVLRGVARRRGAGFEALVGNEDPRKAKPRARFSHMVSTGVPPSTQRRWRRKAGTETQPAAVSDREVSYGYQLETKYLPEGPYRIAKTKDGKRHRVRQIGNRTFSRFERHRSRTIRKHLSRALLVNGGSEPRAEAGASPVRYADSPKTYIRQRRKGFEPRLLLGDGIMQHRVCKLYYEDAGRGWGAD